MNAKERKIAEDALARNQEQKPSSREIIVGKTVVQLRKQGNNCFRLQYNLDVTSKFLNMTDSADKIRAINYHRFR